jgi:chromosome segregation ATPase
MNKEYQELLAEFNTRNTSLENKEELLRSMNSRLFKAKQAITTLEQEKTELKEQRPDLLAEGKSVDKLNKRLKEIEEEIELKEDEIVGLTKKIPEIKSELYTLCQHTNTVYSELINICLQEVCNGLGIYAKNKNQQK